MIRQRIKNDNEGGESQTGKNYCPFTTIKSFFFFKFYTNVLSEISKIINI